MTRGGGSPSFTDLSAGPQFRAGTRLGPYEITGHVGSGGMGEVYRAHDDRLRRDVAIKVISRDHGSSPEFVRRFELEARAASALSHPHILAVYDVGSHDGLAYLVTELLEGETLAQRMRKGRLALPRVLEWTGQAARALAAVHEHGILHRDLKPSNLFVTADGQLKILDFGLAKRGPALGGSPPSGSVSETSTEPGVLVGTVGYMSPEQVRGDPLDPRSDQFSLGCVLYEMLTGHAPFRRASVAQTLAAVLQDEPASIVNQDPRVPAPVAWTVERCLAKDREDRYAATRDLARDLELALRHLSDQSGHAPTPASRSGRLGLIAPWAVAAAAVVAALLAIRRPPLPPASVSKRFVVTLADVDHLVYDQAPALSFLPDGSGFAFAGQRGPDWRIHLYTLHGATSRPLVGTERGRHPFFSPDGRWIGFYQSAKLMKQPIDGGAPVVVSEEASGGGATWGSDGRIVFTRRTGLWHVPASGGPAQLLTTVDAEKGAVSHVGPYFLPGDKGVAFTILSKSGALEDAAIAVVPSRGGEPRVLVKGGASPRYASTGHLLYVRGTDLMAVPFDVDRLTVMGSPVPVVLGVLTTPQYLHGQFDVAVDGTLAYVPDAGARLRTFHVIDRRGAARPLPIAARPYIHPRLLPDGHGLIVEIEETPHNLWHVDLRSGALTQLTRDSANHRPVLSPDGRCMVFSSDRTTPRSLFRQPTDGSGGAEMLLQAPHAHNATSWSRDGQWIAFTENHPDTKGDIWVMNLGDGRRTTPFLKTPFTEQSAVFSPDGRWIAYVSNESGRDEVLVTAFPGPGPRKQVSTNGGELPLFSLDGRTLFYRLGDKVLAAEIATTPSLTSSTPRVAFEVHLARAASAAPIFDIFPAGDSFLAVMAAGEHVPHNRVDVIVNWFEELRRIAPSK